MNTYVYAYKTSDGVRHEERMRAESREKVFETLRAQGIKAIKVVAADGSKANGEIRGVGKRVAAAFVVGAALLAGSIVYFALRSPRHEPSPALVVLREKAEIIAKNHRHGVELADGDRDAVRKAIEEARSAAKDIFKGIMVELTDAQEQTEAKRLYGELMILVDHTELSLD